MNAFRNLATMAWAMLVWPKFSVSSYRILSHLVALGVSPRTVIDVGANVGQFSIAASRMFDGCDIYAFEPLPSAASAYRKNLRTYGAASLREIAVSNRAGRSVLNVNRHSHSSSLLELGSLHQRSFPRAKVVGTIEVETDTLDAALAGIELRCPILLKVDVQGAEARVIGGAAQTLRAVDHVLLECSLEPMYEDEPTFEEIQRLMQASGFRLVGKVGWLKQPRTRKVLQIDALFARESPTEISQ